MLSWVPWPNPPVAPSHTVQFRFSLWSISLFIIWPLAPSSILSQKLFSSLLTIVQPHWLSWCSLTSLTILLPQRICTLNVRLEDFSPRYTLNQSLCCLHWDVFYDNKLAWARKVTYMHSYSSSSSYFALFFLIAPVIIWHLYIDISVWFSSVAQSCLTLCNTMNRSMPGLPVHHQLLEFTQTQCPLSRWHYQAISSSVVPFSSCPQSLPASESFPMSQLMRWPKYWSFQL